MTRILGKIKCALLAHPQPAPPPRDPGRHQPVDRLDPLRPRPLLPHPHLRQVRPTAEGVRRMSAAKDIQGPDPASLSDREFDAILVLSTTPYTVVVLQDARWTHRGRWHLTGVLRGRPYDVLHLAHLDTVEIIYADKSSETLTFVVTDLVHRVEINNSRLSVYIHGTPRYPKGRSTEPRVGSDLSEGQRPALKKILNDYLPGIVDDQRRGWILSAVTTWVEHEIVQSTNKLARQLADEHDRREDLRKKIGDLVEDWLIDNIAEHAENSFTKISEVLVRDERGLPL